MKANAPKRRSAPKVRPVKEANAPKRWLFLNVGQHRRSDRTKKPNADLKRRSAPKVRPVKESKNTDPTKTISNPNFR
jgi:hypothetical protein